MGADAEMATAIRDTAGRLGINPSDLATAISYETGGKFSPSLYGGAGGKYLGLIQFGPAEQERYGVTPKQSATEQMGAVENFLRDRGVKPGHGLLDIYSTINAGSPGRYNASDANNGGAPGTVADKVGTQMVGHRLRAENLLGGTGGAPGAVAAAPAAVPTALAASNPVAAVPGAPPASSGSLLPSLAAGAGGTDAQMTDALQGIAAAAQQKPMAVPDMPAIRFPVPPGMARARLLARAAAARKYA